MANNLVLHIANIYTDLNLKLVKLQINTWSLTAQYIIMSACMLTI